MKKTESHYLKHHLLIAMPHLDDPNFAHRLVYLVEHGPDGAMGLVVNHPGGLCLADILEQIRPEPAPPARCQQIPVYTGGPVQTERGFVLHPPGGHYQATLGLGELDLTSSQDILFAIADGQGPDRYLIALGYAGWEAGQLEREVAANTWLTCPAREDLLFELPAEQRLAAAAASLGINLGLLSSQAGHA